MSDNLNPWQQTSPTLVWDVAPRWWDTLTYIPYKAVLVLVPSPLWPGTSFTLWRYDLQKHCPLFPQQDYFTMIGVVFYEVGVPQNDARDVKWHHDVIMRSGDFGKMDPSKNYIF